MKTKILFPTIVATFLFVGSAAMAKVRYETVSVVAQAAKEYQRQELPDGSFRPETYVLVNGGMFPGTIRDASFDKVSYPKVAGLLAQQLATQNYFLARKSADADLLIVVHWGLTVPFSDATAVDTMLTAAQAVSALNFERNEENRPQTLARNMLQGPASQKYETLHLEEAADSAVQLLIMENRYRDMMNERNARLLGYLDEINERNGISRWAGAGTAYDDLVSDIEHPRYYVVIGAYDFPAARKGQKKVLRWVARISIDSQGNSFDERVATMVANAARYFGRNSNGLLRRYQPEYRVDLGETQFLGVAPDPVAVPVNQAEGDNK